MLLLRAIRQRISEVERRLRQITDLSALRTDFFGTITRLGKAKAEPAANPSTSAKNRVLVVDDADAIRSLVSELLVQRNFDVVGAACAEEGIEAVLHNAEPFDLIISDFSMPGLDGIAMGKELRARGCTSKFIFFSGYSQEMLNVDGLGFEDFGYLTKPFTTKHFYETVNKALGIATQAHT